VINITATRPPGNVGMVNARSLSSAFVVAHPNTNKEEAVKLWESQPKRHQASSHIDLETRLLWITAPRPQ
jgi:hypothetical protein